MRKLTKIIATSLLIASTALTGCDSSTPRDITISPSGSPDTIVFMQRGTMNYGPTNFKDYKPFGSLDEAIKSDTNGNITTLKPGDEGFEREAGIYEQSYKQVFQER